MKKKIRCLVDTCDRDSVCLKMCGLHYQRHWRGASLDPPARITSRPHDHGMSKTVEYGIWRGIKSRCLNKNRRGYANYGGRGIKVCERWMDFDNFYKDMGRRPTPKHTVERIDNDGDYEPGNCKWATYLEQAANRRPPVYKSKRVYS